MWNDNFNEIQIKIKFDETSSLNFAYILSPHAHDLREYLDCQKILNIPRNLSINNFIRGKPDTALSGWCKLGIKEAVDQPTVRAHGVLRYKEI